MSHRALAPRWVKQADDHDAAQRSCEQWDATYLRHLDIATQLYMDELVFKVSAHTIFDMPCAVTLYNGPDGVF